MNQVNRLKIFALSLVVLVLCAGGIYIIWSLYPVQPPLWGMIAATVLGKIAVIPLILVIFGSVGVIITIFKKII